MPPHQGGGTVVSFPYAGREMESLQLVAGWPVGRAAVGVVPFVAGPDGPGGMPGPVETAGDEQWSFPWASVTKPATALAALVAVEEGTIALDEPAGPAGATVRHLLAHASGLGPEPGPPVAAPGARRVYSNAGFELLADLIAARSGMPFAEYLTMGVLAPLGMVDTVLALHTPVGGAAAGLSGPLVDLLALGREWAVPTLVSSQTWRAATSVQFPALSGVLPGFGPYDPCQWGLGVEVRGAKQPHWTGHTNGERTFGHFGRSGSFLWVDPEAGLVCAGLADRPFGVWAANAWPVLADALLAEHLRRVEV